MSRKIIPFVVALGLICLVMAVAAVFSFSGLISAQKFGANTAWSKPYSSAESMKVIDFTGDGQDELFVQNTSDVTVYDGNGAVMWNFPYSSPKTTLGDVDGKLLALSLDGKPLWRSKLGGNEVRSMDDAKIDGQTYAAIATNDGH